MARKLLLGSLCVLLLTLTAANQDRIPRSKASVAVLDAHGQRVGTLHAGQQDLVFEFGPHLTTVRVRPNGFEGGSLSFQSTNCSGTAYVGVSSGSFYSQNFVAVDGTLFLPAAGATPATIDTWSYRWASDGNTGCRSLATDGGGPARGVFVRAVAATNLYQYHPPPFKVR